MESKVESRVFAVKRHEAALLQQAKEIKELRHELSAYEMLIFKLNMKGMYAFCVCM
jgi:hypothetical protein